MSYYTEEELLGAINQAYSAVVKSKRSLLGFKFGKNDCWSLFCLYDKTLREDESFLDNKITNYTSDFTFIREFKKAGFNSAEELLVLAGYEIIHEKEKRIGDVAFAAGAAYNTKTAIINTGRGWLNSGPDPRFDLVPYNMVSKFYAIGRPIRKDNNANT